MGKLVVDKSKLNPNSGEAAVKLCPFGAISYNGENLEISSACKMCKLGAKKSGGVIENKEDEEKKPAVDKSLWNGICVYADNRAGKIHRVTYELCGKAVELSKVTGHPVYALVIGSDIGNSAEKL